MMFLRMNIYLVFFFSACGEKETAPPVFQSSSNTSSNSFDSNDQNGEENNDTDDQTSTDPEGSITEESPIIDNLSSFFNVDSDGIDIIETHVMFTDAQNDVENGQMFLEYSSDSTSGDLGMEIGGAYVTYESGDDGYELTHYLYDIDPTAVYAIKVQIQDIAGNLSEEDNVNVNPVDE